MECSPAVELRKWLESMADPMQEPWSDWEEDDRDGDAESEYLVDEDRSGIVIDPTVGFRSRTDLTDKNSAKSRGVDDRGEDGDHPEDVDGDDEDDDETEDYSDDTQSCDSGFTSSMDGAGKHN